MLADFSTYAQILDAYYKSMFEDKAKYNAIMRAVGTIVYRDIRSGRKQDVL